MILFANRQTADQVIDLAFGIARANAELLSSEAGAAQNAAAPSSPKSIDRRQEQLDARQKSLIREMAEARKQPGAAAKGKQAKLEKLQDELDAVNARMNLLDTWNDFVC